MKKGKIWLGLIFSLGIGVLTGLLGGGGGMLCVPILAYFFGLEAINAHASALLVMLITSISSSCFYITNSFKQIDVFALIVVSGILIAGSLVGTKLLSISKNKFISGLFAFVMLGAGIFMVIR